MNDIIIKLQKENEELGNEIIRLKKIINKAIQFIEDEALYDNDLGKIYTSEEVKLLRILGDKK